jgi:hypothetical protein
MSKGMKAIVLALIGLVLWIIIAYSMVAFVQAKANPFQWSEGSRFGLCGMIILYIVSIPIIISEIKDQLK